MIVHFENPQCRQKDYGLEIPLLSVRSSQILGAIRSHEKYVPLWESHICQINPGPISRQSLLRVHEEKYVNHLLSDLHAEAEVIRAYELKDKKGDWFRYDPKKALLPLSDLVYLQLREAQATLEAGKIARESGFAYLLGGGMHHAMYDCGRGFCLVNDLVLLAYDVLKNPKYKNVWIIDVDAHKGDGTASLTEDFENIVTLSIHMAKGWPLEHEVPDDPRVLVQSTIDIGIDEGRESTYIDALQNGIETLKSQYPQPDFVIVVNGSDPFEGDTLPSAAQMKLSLLQLLTRDMLLFDEFRSLAVPQLWVMAGGYGDQVYKVHAQFLIELLRSGKIQADFKK